MNWKNILTISLSTLFISACGTDDNAINDTARTNQYDEVGPRSVTYNNTDNNRRYDRVRPDNSVGNVNNGILTNVSDNAAYWDGRFNNRNVDNTYIDNWVSRGISQNDTAYRNDAGNRNRNDNVTDDFTGTNTTRNINNNATDMNNRNVTNIENRNTNADRAEQRISKLNEIDHANVTISNNDAYVTVKLEKNGDSELSNDLKREISNVVKSTNQNINNVYISHNPN